MKKADYFIRALQTQHALHKDWVIRCFSINKDYPDTHDYPLPIFAGERHYEFKDNDERITLEDAPIDQPLFKFKESLTLKKGDLINVNHDMTTTYGRALVNAIILIYPFGDKIPFINKEIKLKEIDEIIKERLTTDPQYHTKDTWIAENPIYVSEYLKYVDAAFSLEGFTPLATPSASERSLGRHPDVEKTKKALLEQHKDNLLDPVVVAKIQDELIALDKEWIKGDLAEGFYPKEDYYSKIRIKLHGLYGYDPGFGIAPGTITRALSEGWSIDDMPTFINALRNASYSRGVSTQLGGFATKNINRTFQSFSISEKDCKTTVGLPRFITKETSKNLIGFYQIKGTTSHLVTSSNHESLINKTVIMRSPLYCKTKSPGYCEMCMGKANSENKLAPGALVAAMTSQIMYIAMKTMHGTVLSTAEYDMDLTIS